VFKRPREYKIQGFDTIATTSLPSQNKILRQGADIDTHIIVEIAEIMATMTMHSIPLLTNDNYPQWLIDIKAVLRRQKL
jgi:hypothetical protein